MADERIRRRRRSRRRKIVVIGVSAAVIAGGAGTAWAMSGSDGPSYRLAEVSRADIAQTVDADGTLTSQDTATQSFAAAGTVQSVLVKTGQHVSAGEVLATLSRSSLKADVTTAKNTLASARQTLADNEAGQSSSVTTSSGTTSSGTTSSGTTSTTSSGSSATNTSTANTSTANTSTATTDSATTGTGRDGIVLVSDETSARDTSSTTAAAPSSAVTKAEAVLKTAQQSVVRAQSGLDADVSDLTSACVTSGDTETTEHITADSTGSASGTVDGASVVTIADGSTTSDNPQTVASGDSWTFAGLTAGQTYGVVVVPVVDESACTTAISNVSDAKGSKGDTSTSTLYGAIDALDHAVTDLETAAARTSTSGSSGSGSSGSGSSGSGSSGSGTSGSGSTGTSDSTGTGTSGSTGSGGTSGGTTTGGTKPGGGTTGSTTSGSTSHSTSGSTAGSSTTSRSSNSSSSSTTITASQIAADQKAIDAEKAALAVARNDMLLATLTTPISGTVASVDISTGSAVSASSSTNTIVVTTDRALSVPVDISLADIDLIKLGEQAAVTVDGRSRPLDAKVSMIGLSNASSSTGSSSEYEVTLVLAKSAATLYDGMGASVAIDVGTARHAISVPVSAVSTTGTTSAVEVYSDGKETAAKVTLGVQGDSRVQVTSGVTVGDEVVLADLDEALPSTDSDSTSGSSALTGGSGSSARGFGAGGNGGGAGGGIGGPP